MVKTGSRETPITLSELRAFTTGRGKIDDAILGPARPASRQFLITSQHPVDPHYIPAEPVCIWVVSAGPGPYSPCYTECGCAERKSIYGVVDLDRAFRKTKQKRRDNRGRTVCLCMGHFIE